MEQHINQDAWDERTLGADEAHVAQAPDDRAFLDASLNLQPISIRLQRDLLDNLKALAQLNGIGYQPLIRQILTRWVDCELKNMLKNRALEAAERQSVGGSAPEGLIEESVEKRAA